MPTNIDLAELDRLTTEGVVLIEVLPRGEYDEEHLPDAVNIPLRDLDSASLAHHDRSSPIVVYCWDSL